MPPEMELKHANVQEWAQTYQRTHDVSLLARQLTESSAWGFFPINHHTNKDFLERHSAKPDVTIILADLPPRIILAIIQGRLHEKVKSDRKCKEWQASDARVDRKDHIAIYANAVVDKNGIHPTIRETRKILELMNRYLAGENEVVETINRQITNTEWASNLGFEQWRYIPNSNVKENVLGFIQKATLRCDLAENNGDDVDEPLRYGFHEVGYAKVVSDRLESHAKHQSSNTIMNLFESCASRINPKFSVDGIVVHRIWFRCLASRAEIYLTILFHCWTFDGTGFTYFFPGASVESSAKEELILQGSWSKSAAHTYHFNVIKKALKAAVIKNEKLRQEIARLDEEEAGVEEGGESYAQIQIDAILKETDALQQQLLADLEAIGHGLDILRAD